MQAGIHPESPWKLIDQLKQKKIIYGELKCILRNYFDEIAAIQLRAYLAYDKHHYMIYFEDSQKRNINDKRLQDEQKLFKLIQTLITFQNKLRNEFHEPLSESNRD